MERTKETLEARVRETPLVDRLKECQQRIGNMCAELRGPKMSIPVEYYDDDFYICTTLADAQATVEALQARVKELQGIADEKCRCFLERAEQSEKQLTQCTAELDALQRVRDEFERERDQLHAALMEAKAALDAERAEIAKVRATCDMLGKERNEADEAKYHAELKLTQLQALVRALPNIEGEIMVSESLVLAEDPDMCSDMSDKREAEAYAALLRYRASLDATTPDSNQLGAINDMVSKGGDGE